MSLQMYYDNTTLSDNSLFVDHQNLFDVDFQDGFHLGDSQQMVWGLGYRSIIDRNDPSFSVSLQPNQLTLNQFSAFLQDEISLVHSLRLTVGSKFEHNAFTGFEFEPNVRLLWTMTPNQSIWTAVSRAVRTPALTEEGLRLTSAVVPPGIPQNPTPFPALITVYGSHNFQSEDLLAYELGYRVQVTSTSLDGYRYLLQPLFESANCRARRPFCRRQSGAHGHSCSLHGGQQNGRRNVRRRTHCRLESHAEVETRRFLQLPANGHHQEL